MGPGPGVLSASHPGAQPDLLPVARIAGARVVPWLNGLGTTRVLRPRRGDGWWVSAASLVESCEFSSFPGVERVLTPVGAAVELTVDGVQHHLPPGRPFRFDGAAHVSATLPEGPLTALNVFADTTGTRLDVRVRRAHGLVRPGAALVLLDGVAHLADGRDLGPMDLVEGPVQVQGTVLVIDVTDTTPRRTPS